MPKKNWPTFEGNTYVQHNNAKFALWGEQNNGQRTYYNVADVAEVFVRDVLGDKTGVVLPLSW